jgi:hypothetical protein
MLPTKFLFIWPSSFRGEDLKKSANQKQELLTDWDKISNLYRGSLIGAFYQVLLHLAKRLQSRFLKIDQSETRMACGGHVC